MRMSKTMRVRIGTAGALILLLAACGRDDGAGVRTIDEGTGSATASGAGGTASGAGGSGSGAGANLDPAKADARVSVALSEWAVTPQPAEVKAGVIAFDVKNEGGTLHEVVVLRANGVEALSTKPDGTADEDALGAENAIGEIEVPVGETGTVAFQLEPGNYVLICNILDEEGHAHFKEGMRTPFTVT
jgi:uncharacterized cupredoxin-like copper-binding protein